MKLLIILLFLLVAIVIVQDDNSYWPPIEVLDQSFFPMCVATAGKGFIESGTKIKVDYHQLYARSYESDGLPIPHEGTTNRAMLEVLQDWKLVDNIQHSQKTSDAIRWLNSGPIILQMKWYDNWLKDSLASDGYYTPVGTPRNIDHDIFCYGYDMIDGFKCQNSWGPDWGQKGRFRIHRWDFDQILLDGGSVWTAHRLSFPTPVTRP